MERNGITGRTDKVVFETLEPRLLLSGTHYVVNSFLHGVADDGFVSFSEALIAARDNIAVTSDVAAGSYHEADTISFDPTLFALAPQSYRVALTLTESINIIGPGEDLLTFVSLDTRPTLQITGSDVEVNIQGVTITGSEHIIPDPYPDSWAEWYGGGVTNSANLTLTNVTFDGIDDQSGAVALVLTNDGGQVTLDHCTFTNNDGGLKNLGEDAVMTIMNSTITGQTTGMAIYNSAGQVEISDSEITGNVNYHVDYSNYGIVRNGTGEMTITNSVIAGNYSYENAALENGAGNMKVINSVLVGNKDKIRVNSSGIDVPRAANNETGNLTFKNSTIVGIAEQSDYEMLSGAMVIYNSIVYQGSVSPQASIHYSLVGVDPKFARDPHMGPDGGWATADDDYGDLRLQADSPAIDAAGGDPILPTTDIVGTVRYDDPATINTGVGIPTYYDIGAYEMLPLIEGDVSQDYQLSLDDYDILYSRLGDGRFDLDGDGDMDEDDLTYFAEVMMGCEYGDVNLDGAIDLGDYEIVYANFGKDRYDLDGDGITYKADLDYLIFNLIGTTYGDANLDGVVGLLDLDIIGRNYGMSSGMRWVNGDFNATGSVTLLDLDLLGLNWGASAMVAKAEQAGEVALEDSAAMWWMVEDEDDAQDTVAEVPTLLPDEEEAAVRLF